MLCSGYERNYCVHKREGEGANRLLFVAEIFGADFVFYGFPCGDFSWGFVLFGGFCETWFCFAAADGFDQKVFDGELGSVFADFCGSRFGGS